ncbi:uncharacterized protein LOC110232089 [Exaiptasia diaphana]|nr:uncharacterized protein LOC110232089 [Exaiptasia diaphana]
MEYAALLEKFINESHTRKQQEEKKRKEQEISHNQYDPFKKPGGGAPLTNEQGEVNAKQILTLSTDIKELRGVEPRHQHAYSDPGKCKPDDYAWLNPDSNHWPFGKNTVERDRAGKIMKTKRPAIDDSEGIGIPVGRPGAGAPIKDKDGKLKTRKPQTLTKNSYGQVLSRDFSPKERIENDPFQKPGAGAPIKDADGKVKTRLVAQVERLEPSPRMSFDDIQAKQAYLKTLQDQAEQAEYKRKEENEDLKKSGGDVSSWIRSGVVGQPKFDPVTKEIIASHKTTSDVTQQKLNIRRQKNDTSSNYHRDLQVLVDAKQKQRYQEKETEKHDSMRHVETMNSNWGKKGGGAPLDGYRKQKFGLDPYDETSFRPN